MIKQKRIPERDSLLFFTQLRYKRGAQIEEE